MSSSKKSAKTRVLSKREILRFQALIFDYYQVHERSFAWRESTDPYEILVSEFMLQQTQTSRVVPYFENFISTFPSFNTLAEADVARVLKLWQGLGYNRRALNLQRSAQEIVSRYEGELPEDTSELLSLPGVGSYTAQALRAFVFNLPVVLIETNIRAVYINHFFPDSSNVHDKELLPFIEATLWQEDPRSWYYALMDYGVHLKSLNREIGKRSAHYVRQSPFLGSRRQVRGAIIRELSRVKGLSLKSLHQKLEYPEESVESCLEELEAEGFLVKTADKVFLGKALN